MKYCLDTLKDLEPMEGFEKGVRVKKELHDVRMNCEDGKFGIDKDTFKKVINKFKHSGKHNYDFLTKTGPKYQDTIFKFCQRMIQEEIFPKYFQQTTLNMLFKGGKGKKEELASNRFIHSKTWLPLLAKGLVVEAGLKAPLLANSSRYQVGGQEHHRAEELLFCKKSIMAKNLKEGRIQLSKFFDISKYFDRESLVDTMDMMYRREVDPKACRLWAKLNLDTRV